MPFNFTCMRTVTIWYSAHQVRRSAAKCLSAVLGSRPELLSEFYKSVSPALIARFKGTIVSQYFCKLISLCSLLSSCYSNFLWCRKGELHRSTVLIEFTFSKLGKKEYMYRVIGLLPVQKSLVFETPPPPRNFQWPSMWWVFWNNTMQFVSHKRVVTIFWIVL